MKPTRKQRHIASKALRNAKATIEGEQGLPLSLDQASTIHDVCVVLDIDPILIIGDRLAFVGDSLAEFLLGVNDENTEE